MNDFTMDRVRYARWRERCARDTRALRSFPICPKMSLATVPFQLYALISHDVCDVMALNSRKRSELWLEYAYEMKLMGFEPQLASLFGLYVSFP